MIVRLYCTDILSAIIFFCLWWYCRYFINDAHFSALILLAFHFLWIVLIRDYFIVASCNIFQDSIVSVEKLFVRNMIFLLVLFGMMSVQAISVWSLSGMLLPVL